MPDLETCGDVPKLQPLPPKEEFDLPPQAVMRLGQHSVSSC